MRRFVAIFLTFSTFTAVSSAFADCVDQNGRDISNGPDMFLPLIASKKTCYEARNLAESCAWGAGTDSQTAGAAYRVCEAQLKKNNPEKPDLDLLVAMEKRCDVQYGKLTDAMYLSMNVYCHLSSIEWIVNVTTEATN